MNCVPTLSRLVVDSHLRCLPVIVSQGFHTSCPRESRIKRAYTHKPFFHTKKTAKHADEPLTVPNKAFIQDLISQTYGNKMAPYVRPVTEDGSKESGGSLLRPELRPWSRGQWDEEGVRTTRVGLIGRKIGVVPMWYKDGTVISTTMVQIEDNHVIRYIPPEDFAKTIVAEKRSMPFAHMRGALSITRGSLVVGALSADPAKFTKDYCGLFTESGVMPKKKLFRFPVSANALIQPGTPLNAAHFCPGQYVDVIGRTTRRGFQGVMKRWGFSGMPSDERGVTKSHRRPGCIGSGRDKSRVWPGQKMPGHMGGLFRRMLGLQIVRINYKHNILYIKGQALPGEPGEFVKIFDCKMHHKRLQASPRFFPTCYPEEYDNLPEEEYTEGIFRFEDPSITYSSS